MKISAIIPCYKGEKYISKCLENLLAQNYKDLEIIVVVDGNLDRTAEIASKFPVKVVVLEKNRGVSIARNTGIKEATGDYIHFMDVDDEISDDFYANLSAAVQKTGADIACAGIIHERQPYKCQIFHKEKLVSSTRKKMRITWVGKLGYSCRYLIRRSLILKNNLFFEADRIVEDLPFSFKALYYADKVVAIPDAVYIYRFNENSLITTRTPERKQLIRTDHKHAVELISNFAKEHNFTIPGVGFNFGTLAYVARKYYIKTRVAIGYRMSM